MQYTLKLAHKDTRTLFIPNGATVVVLYSTRLGVTDPNGSESTLTLPAIKAILDKDGDEIVVASGTVLHGDGSGGRDLAVVLAAATAGSDDGIEREPRRVPVIL